MLFKTWPFPELKDLDKNLSLVGAISPVAIEEKKHILSMPKRGIFLIFMKIFLWFRPLHIILFTIFPKEHS
ncbi:hypothetical protein AB834_07175 [PVC group bacterium (ex Bugula neritina AB1)]|nr:hypothetical protein AB834_07175 [PVC group bacterium (ex Bugula neritina AB1)]